MKLKLVFRVFAGLQFLLVIGAIFIPAAVMEGFGIEYNAGTAIVLQFSILSQLMIILIAVALPSWLGNDLSKAALTFSCISLMPVLLNFYHILSGILPITGAVFVENSMWFIFALSFYLFKNK
jgi:hypothetical protein